MITEAELEEFLASRQDGVWSTASLAGLDEGERFPSEAVSSLDDVGLPERYVLSPEADFTEMVSLVRAVARRDLTVAIAHGKTFLGAASVWVAGTPDQADRLAARIRGGEVVCWGLTERGHGADLLAGEFSAIQDGDAWRLDGEKWLINNATRADLACVLARTDAAGGARGFSLFLVDRRQLPETAWRCLPKVRTHGIRGADISGFIARDAVVPADALVGAVGGGVETVLKALQLTRIVCGGLSLGAADHALLLARDFVTVRELYGRGLAEIPHTRRILGKAATSVLIAEAVTTLATRSVHALPGEASVTSAICKAFVPTRVQTALVELAELLGARGFLTSAPGNGFAKLERDHRICAIFDGSTVVNRAALLHQMPRLGRLLRRRRVDAGGVRAASNLALPVAPFDRERLALISASGCSVVQSLPDAVARIRERGEPELTRLAELALAEVDGLDAAIDGFVPVSGGLPSSAFALAQRYEKAYAISACLLLWLENDADKKSPLWTDALWLRACLGSLLGDDDISDAMASVVLEWTGTRFSLLGGAL